MKTEKKLLCLFLGLMLLFWIAGCSNNSSDSSGETQDYVSITAKDAYYEVVIDYSSGDRYSIGREYGSEVLEIYPEYEKTADSFIMEIVASLTAQDPDVTYDVLIERAKEISRQVDSDYMQEIEGFASVLSGGTENVAGDNKLSRDELLILNFNPDVSTINSCSAIAVFGDRSATGKTIVGRNTDWFAGSTNQMGCINAVTHLKNGDKEILSVGWLGFSGCIVALSNDGVFVANLYSSIGAAYSAVGKRAVMIDIREALETESTLEGVASFLGDSQKLYGYHHLMYLADKDKARVLENDFERNRALRSYDSTLNEGITWGFTNAVAAVNSFVLEGNFDNHTKKPLDPEQPNYSNLLRWANFKTELSSKGDTADFDGIKSIMSYHKEGAGGKDEGDIFGDNTLHSVIYSFSDNKMEAWFYPKSGGFVDNPVYTSITVPFTPSN